MIPIRTQIQFDAFSLQVMSGQLEKSILHAMRTSHQVAISRIKQHHQSKHMHQAGGFFARSPRDSIARRGGTLSRSYQTHVTNRGATTTAVYGSKLRRAKNLEDGTVIRPASGQYLTIPLRPGLSGARAPGQFIMRARNGKIFVWRKEGRDRIVPLYILKKLVRIPPRPTIWMTANETLRRTMRFLQDSVGKAAT